MNSLRSSATALCVVATLSALAGCLGYRVGSSLPPGIQTLSVPTFANLSSEPLVEIDATRATIAEFQKNGNLSIAETANADVLLKVTILSLKTEPISYERDNTKTPSEYRLVIKASLGLTNRKDGKTMLERTVSGDTVFEPGSDLNSAKRSAMPKAAQSLAHSIVKGVVEFW
jgi:hypothetical protein